MRHVHRRAENLYNESLFRTRQTVERLFGVWKRRFPILSQGIRVSRQKLVKADFYIVACVILHNMACQNREGEPPVEIQPPAGDGPNQPQPPNAPIPQRGHNERCGVQRQLINGWFIARCNNLY